MADWTQYLPDGVQNPIAIELRHPASWRQDPDEDNKSRDATIALLADKEFIASRQAVCDKVGADHVSILTIPVGGGDGGGVGVTVHLPPTVTQDPATAAQTVLDWFDSSKIGQIYYSHGQKHGFHGKVGKTKYDVKKYKSLADVKNVKPDYNDGHDHSKAHCACH